MAEGKVASRNCPANLRDYYLGLPLWRTYRSLDLNLKETTGPLGPEQNKIFEHFRSHTCYRKADTIIAMDAEKDR